MRNRNIDEHTMFINKFKIGLLPIFMAASNDSFWCFINYCYFPFHVFFKTVSFKHIILDILEEYGKDFYKSFFAIKLTSNFMYFLETIEWHTCIKYFYFFDSTKLL